MKEEIAAGIRNALERGASMEQASQSFVNAGYNAQEVQEAVQIIMSEGSSSIVYNTPSPVPTPSSPDQSASAPSAINTPVPVSAVAAPVPSIPSPNKKSKRLLVIVGIIAAGLVVVGGVITYLLIAE